MDADSFNLKTLFAFERRHLVPLYQRPYVWKREEQWAPLWEDIVTIADKDLAGAKLRPHFLGAVVLDQIATPSRHVEARLVIDGQQRLTTLQLLLSAFREVCGELGDEESERKLLRLTCNEDAKDGEHGDERFKVWPTNIDQAEFRILMEPLTERAAQVRLIHAKAAESGPRLIAGAYEFFHGAILGWLKSEGSAGVGRRVDCLLETLRERLWLVVIDLGEKDDAQVSFETLNARGTPLLPADLVKNFLFHEAELKQLPLDPLYETYWKPFDTQVAFWRKDVKQGRLFRPQIDVYLQHYLTLQTRDEVPAAHLFSAFKDFARKRPDRSPEDHLRSLAEFAGVFRGFSEASTASRKGIFFQRLELMETTTVVPFLLGLFQRFDSQEHRGRMDTVLSDVESFLLRRMVCRLTTKNYNQLFLELLKQLEDSEDYPDVVVRTFLLDQTAESRRWPDDAEFQSVWSDLSAYKDLSRGRLRMLLEAIEAALRNDRSEDVALRPTQKLTVEHLLPQAWEEHWPLPEGVDREQAVSHRNAVLHRFGNLTLLTKKLNPAVSNSGWTRKRMGILDNSLLALNRRFQGVSTWDEDAIHARTGELFSVARRVWPRPEHAN